MLDVLHAAVAEAAAEDDWASVRRLVAFASDPDWLEETLSNLDTEGEPEDADDPDNLGVMSEDVSTFAGRAEGEKWSTGGRWYERQSGRTVRIASPDRAAASTPPPTPPAVAREKHLAARASAKDAAHKIADDPHAAGLDGTRQLLGHLAKLTVKDYKELRVKLGAKSGRNKLETARRIVAAVKAKLAATPAPPPTPAAPASTAPRPGLVPSSPARQVERSGVRMWGTPEELARPEHVENREYARHALAATGFGPGKTATLSDLTRVAAGSPVHAKIAVAQLEKLGEIVPSGGDPFNPTYSPGPNWGKPEAAAPAPTPAAAPEPRPRVASGGKSPGDLSRGDLSRGDLDRSGDFRALWGAIRGVVRGVVGFAEPEPAPEPEDVAGGFALAVLDALERGDEAAYSVLLKVLDAAGGSPPEQDAPAAQFAAPGPPPRPGLVWNEDTHRWRNPHTGEEHQHTGPTQPPAATATAGKAHAPPPPPPKLVAVDVAEGAHESVAKVFGAGTDHAKLAQACNALEGASAWVEPIPAGIGGVKVTVANPGGGVAVRSFYKRSDGSVVCNNLWFKNPEGSPARGADILLDQVQSLRAMGVTHISTRAARQDSDDPEKKMVGYLVWPKLGYEGTIPEKLFAKLPPDVRAAMGEKKGSLFGLVGAVPGSRSLRKLYDEVPGGPEAWARHGDSVDMFFDLRDGSPNMVALEKYHSKPRSPKLS